MTLPVYPSQLSVGQIKNEFTTTYGPIMRVGAVTFNANGFPRTGRSTAITGPEYRFSADIYETTASYPLPAVGSLCYVPADPVNPVFNSQRYGQIVDAYNVDYAGPLLTYYRQVFIVVSWQVGTVAAINEYLYDYTVSGGGIVSMSSLYAGGGIVPPNTVGFPLGGAGVAIPSSGSIRVGNFHGSGAGTFTLTLGNSTTTLNLTASLRAAGWNRRSPVRVIVPANVYVRGAAGTRAMYITGPFPGGITLEVNGFILGGGGDGGDADNSGTATFPFQFNTFFGGSGRPAIELYDTGPVVAEITNTGAICGGGGGGGCVSLKGAGGGGAGGGAGGGRGGFANINGAVFPGGAGSTTNGLRGSDGIATGTGLGSGGGGGLRVNSLPAGGGNGGGGAGGEAGGGGGASLNSTGGNGGGLNFSGSSGTLTASSPAVSCGGGGGWGAAGGSGTGRNEVGTTAAITGGLGGRAVRLVGASSFTYTLAGSAKLYGAISA